MSILTYAKPDYDAKWGRYRIRLAGGDITKHREMLTDLLTRSFRESA